ncbi:MAG: NADH-quinone oxidoreductase subunit NuoF [Myxococcota bacterium]
MAVQTSNHLLRRGMGKDFRDLSTYRAAGGYSAVRKAWEMGKEAVVEEVKRGSVRGRGGAGFPAGIKWGFMPKDLDKPRYLVVNADEGEPGTFKDTYFLKEDPHRLIEGCIISSMALDIHAVYIYIRGEFAEQIATTWKAIEDCYKAGLLGDKVMGIDYKLDVYVHPGAGAYICGEETALLESLEGKPGRPRMKPPFPAVVGAFGCPTLVNNVETIAAVPLIIDKGADWWMSLGVERDGGPRLVGISGHVKTPGLYEVATGSNLREVIYELGGGVLEDRAIKAVIPGGTSSKVLRGDEIDVPMTIDGLKEVGSMLGTCGIMVIAEGTCIVRALQRVSHFYSHESCGQCTPCREGTGWMARILDMLESGEATQRDFDMLTDIAGEVAGNTICALGEAAAWPVQSYVEKFHDDFQAHVDHGGCPMAGQPTPGGF